MEHCDSRRIKEIRDNTARIADAFNRIADEIQLFREAFVANNMSICESCSNNPCNKKAMLGDRRIYECTLYERAEQTEPQTHDLRTDTHECVKDTHDKTESNSEKPNNCEDCRWWDGKRCHGIGRQCNYEPKDEPQTEFIACPIHEDDAWLYEDEPQTEDLQDWKDRMWVEAVIEPQTDCPWK